MLRWEGLRRSLERLREVVGRMPMTDFCLGLLQALVFRGVVMSNGQRLSRSQSDRERRPKVFRSGFDIQAILSTPFANREVGLEI